ncbi:MAG: DUF1553 domain-containing protein, partial [Planctomycetota bacterium]
NEGDVIQPLTGKPQSPAPLDSDPIPMEGVDRRAHLARWLTSPENSFFGRAIANRIWANFFGRGLVDAVDDMRLTNPASNEKLLDALAAHLREQRFDLRSLVREILRSEAFQRSSLATPENRADPTYFSRFFPRRLMAEVALDALSSVCDVPTKFGGYPSGWRAIQLPDSNVSSKFLEIFGRPSREETCSCERTSEASLASVLHVSNSDTVNQKIESKNGRVARALDSKQRIETIIEELYLAALCRFPSARERDRIVAVYKKTPEAERRHFVEDLYWSVLSTREFVFNH